MKHDVTCLNVSNDVKQNYLKSSFSSEVITAKFNDVFHVIDVQEKQNFLFRCFLAQGMHQKFMESHLP